MKTDAPESASAMSQRERDKQLGKDITFGLQQTLACYATDFIDPPVSKWFQNKFGNKDHHVTNEHVWYGELVGDSSAFFAYLLTKRMFREPLKQLTTTVRYIADPLLTKMGNKSLAPWAKDAHVSAQDDAYQQKLENYKRFQAENLVDSSIVAGFATSINVGAQKYLFHNGQEIKVILGSKLVGAAATMTLMLGLRSAIPTTIETLDAELDQRFFSKVIRWTKKAFGVSYAEDNAQAAAAPVQAKASETSAELSGDKRARLVHMVSQHLQQLQAAGLDFDVAIAKERQLLLAMREIFDPQSDFAKAFTQQHHALMRKLYQPAAQDIAGGESLISPEVSKESVASILNNRQRDLQALVNMLAQPNARELFHATANAPKFLGEFSATKKESLIHSLLQPKEQLRGEPAVHIYANAKGQLLEHDALAYCFDPEGPLTKIFVRELQQKMPAADGAWLDMVGKHYMADRQHAAIKVVEAFKPDSELMREAIARSQRLQQRYQPPEGKSQPGVGA